MRGWLSVPHTHMSLVLVYMQFVYASALKYLENTYPLHVNYNSLQAQAPC